MARKSAIRRLSELRTLQASFREHPSVAKFHDWTVNFIGAMIIKLEKNKSLTKRMRDKIDSIIDEGVLPIPDSKEADELITYGKFLSKKDEGVLIDFACSMRKGWDLSKKQADFRDSLVSQAKENKINGVWKPSKEVVDKMDLVEKLYWMYSSNYWYTHPGSARSVLKLQKFLKGEMCWFNVDDWEKAKEAVKGKLRIFENPPFRSGSICFIYKWNKEENKVKSSGIVISDIRIEDGKICYDVLIDGILQTLNYENLKKR